MKKFLTILAIAGTLVACNNAADSEADTKDSIDSVANAKIENIDSAAEAKKEIVDSAAEAKKEALDQTDSLNN